MTDEDRADEDVTQAAEAPVAAPARRDGFSTVTLAAVIGLVLVLGLGGLCGWLGYRVYQGHQTGQLRALFLEAGRQGAVNLTSIDHTRAEADVKRVLDSATGAFRVDFASRSGAFVDVVKKAQSTSSGTVTEAGIESMTTDEARVLVAVSVTTSEPGAPALPPRYWRMRLTVNKIDGGAKIAKVDFVR